MRRAIVAAVLVALLAGCSGAATPTDDELAQVCMDLAEPGLRTPAEMRALADRATGTDLELEIDWLADVADTLVEGGIDVGGHHAGVAALCNELTDGRAFPTETASEKAARHAAIRRRAEPRPRDGANLSYSEIGELSCTEAIDASGDIIAAMQRYVRVHGGTRDTDPTLRQLDVRNGWAVDRMREVCP